MAEYILTKGTDIIRTIDGMIIPADLEQIEYQKYLQWLSEGNIPDPIPQLTLEEQIFAVEEKYRPRLDMYLRLIMLTIAADGETQGAKTIEHQNNYKLLADKMNAEIDELYLGGI